jgi:hypothetical protein
MAIADQTTGFEGPDEEIEFDLERDPEDGEGDVEVGVSSDEDEEPAAEVEAAEPEEQPQPAKPKFRKDHRLAELARQRAEAEARAADLERQLRERDEQLNSERVANVKSMETGLTAELAAAKRKLADAYTLGDGEAIASATEEVGRLAADLSTVRAYAAQPAEKPATQQQQQQPQQARIEPRTQAWISENPWFVPSSPDYEPELAVEAQAFAKKLEIRLQREGKATEIGSEAYFNQINEHMARTYPEMFELETAPPAKKVPTMTADRTVAPVQRQDAAMKPKPKSNVVRLSADERDMAERIAPHLPPQQAWANYAKYKK